MPRWKWRPVDAAYFFGYALANYLSLPFLLSSTRFVSSRGQRGVVVDFPDGLDTHCRRQAFHFDDTGLLVAHDYDADVISRFAVGRHFSAHYEAVDGMVFARSRHVLARLGAWTTPLPVLHAELRGFTVTVTVTVAARPSE